MDEEMYTCKLLKEVVEENQTRKILAIVSKCSTIEEATEKIESLLKNN